MKLKEKVNICLNCSKSLKKIMRNLLKYFILALLFFCINITFAQEEEVKDAAKEAQNPLANIISMPFQNNNDFGIGDYDKTGSVVNIQPILPITLGEKGWLLINRFIIPLPKSTPDNTSGNASNTSGMGDITYTAWFSPPGKGKITWGFGPSMIFPTASDDLLGLGKYSIGPSFVFVLPNKKWMGAAIISNWFSVGGDSTRADVNSFYFQLIYTYFLQKKWYVTTAPIILSNWEADKSERWTVPVGGGFGKMFKIGKMPFDFTTQAYYNAVKPNDYSADWQLRVQLKLIFSTGKKNNN